MSDHQLRNLEDSKKLRARMQQSTEARTTLSFYRYLKVADPAAWRDQLYATWQTWQVMGRVYVASEGINAQISFPTHHQAAFEAWVETQPELKGIRLNYAIEDDGKSFFKLIIKVRPKLVADGLGEFAYDPTDSGQHLNAAEFNQLTDQQETVLVDMRNHYESEVGHFQGAITPDVETFREALTEVEELLDAEARQKPLVLYCTGGIRCEKASAYYKSKGFAEVYQLNGGIIEYARQVEAEGLPNKFRGKNFVFDERMVEQIGNEVISQCHQCGTPWDVHVNCANEACNLLFLQCPACSATMEGTCSSACQEAIHLPEEEQRALRQKQAASGVSLFRRSRAQRGPIMPVIPSPPSKPTP